MKLMMQTQLVLLFLALISAVFAEVNVGQPIFETEDPNVDVLPETDDAAEVLEELEGQIFGDVLAAEELIITPNRRHNSPRKCCKLGRQAAENGLFCSIDAMQVQKRPNVVHRQKMKFHGTEVHGKTVYKDFMRRVEKCSVSKASKSMFVKCCEWQEDIRYEMEQCKTLAISAERKACKRRVQSRE